MRRDGIFRQRGKQQLDAMIHAGRQMAARHRGALPAYEQLLWHIRRRTKLLHPSDRADDNRSIVNAGLVDLAMHHADWIRSLELWCPTPQGVWPTFSSLAQHLLARYPVPAFMTSVWLRREQWEPWPQQEWYKHLGRGENIHTMKLPMRLTRVMSHWFLLAPHHLNAVEAIRWAQVRGLGGDKHLARAIVNTRLGRVLENEDFWETVLHFFINHPSLDFAELGPIVDYLQHQRFEWREGVTLAGVFGNVPPPQPQYTMKGRTVASVRRQVADWHEELRKDENRPCFAWRHGPIGDFRFTQGSEAWTITELLSTRALYQEGEAMRHCVASYGHECYLRESSIFSMQTETEQGQQRALTIEVELSSRTIFQIRGKCNRWATDGELAIIRRWAAVEHLQIN